MAGTCKNHPDRETRTKCYRCNDLICDECRIAFLGRSFCSLTCLFKAATSSLRKKQPGKGRISWLRRMPRLSMRGFFNLLIFLILIALWFSLRDLSREVQRLASRPPQSASAAGERFAASMETLPEAMVTRNRIDIEGEAPDNSVITLQVNGRYAGTQMPERNRFRFRDVLLSHGANEIVVHSMDPEGRITLLEKMSTTFSSPTVDYLSRDFTRGSPRSPRIALTFDGGAGDGSAYQILQDLRDKKVFCTMFLTGRFMRRYPAVVKRMVQDGHEIANHTWSHPHLTTFEQNGRHETRTGVSRQSVQDELRRTGEYFSQLTGEKMAPYWRAPFGEHNAEIRQWAAELGYRHVGWTVGHEHGESMDTLDWIADTTHSAYQSAEEVLDKLLHFGRSDGTHANGGIILMHLDTRRAHDRVQDIVPVLIDSMRHEGYEFVSISELMTLQR